MIFNVIAELAEVKVLTLLPVELLNRLLLPVTGIKAAEPPPGTSTSAFTPFAQNAFSCGSETTAPEVPVEPDEPELLELEVAVGAGVAALPVPPVLGVAVPVVPPVLGVAVPVVPAVLGVAVPVVPPVPELVVAVGTEVAAATGVEVAADELLPEVPLEPVVLEVPLIPTDALSGSMRVQPDEFVLPVVDGACAKAVRLIASAAIVATTRAATTNFFFKTHLLNN